MNRRDAEDAEDAQRVYKKKSGGTWNQRLLCKMGFNELFEQTISTCTSTTRAQAWEERRRLSSQLRFGAQFENAEEQM